MSTYVRATGPARNSSWINDLAVEIADYFDTPDFQTDPSGNSDTIKFVTGIVIRAVARDLPITTHRTSDGVYDVMLGECAIGRVYYHSGQGSNKTKGWMASNIDRHYRPTRWQAINDIKDHYDIRSTP